MSCMSYAWQAGRTLTLDELAKSFKSFKLIAFMARFCSLFGCLLSALAAWFCL